MKVVIILQGRYARRKAVIIIFFNEGTRDRSYGHCLIVGISKYPKKVIRKISAKKTTKKSRVKAFIKLVNYNHIMLVCYTDHRSEGGQGQGQGEVIGEKRWFFSKLRF